MSDVSVFVLTLQATAGPENAVPDGRRYHLLVFARGADEAEAERQGLDGVRWLGWTEADLLRIGEITDPGAVPEDLRDAMGKALKTGCAVIVYDEP